MPTVPTLSYRDDIAWDSDISDDGSNCGDANGNVPSANNDTVYFSETPVVVHSMPPWLEELRDTDCICVINGAIHVYLEDANGWMPLMSARVMNHIVSITGSYAPVNYATAAKPYIEIINRNQWPSIVLGNTFTQGYKRYNFQYIGHNKVEFIPITNNTSNKGNFCTVPTQNMAPMKTLSLMYTEKISPWGAIKWISQVFDRRDVRTVLWMIGDMYADFGNKRMFILYGPGGVGKTSVVNIIANAIGGNLVKLPVSTVLMNPMSFVSHNLMQNTLLDAASSRMATTADIEVSAGKVLNMQTIKALTGNDMSDGGVRVSVTIVATMNKLYHPVVMKDHVRADVIRRVVVIPTLSKRSSQDTDSVPIDHSSLQELVRWSIRTRIRYNMPPLSALAVLHTLYQGRHDEVLQVIEPYDSASISDCLSATMLIVWNLQIKHEDMQNALQRIGSDCCVEWLGMLLIARVRLIPGAIISRRWLLDPQPTVPFKRTWTAWKGKSSSAVTSLV